MSALCCRSGRNQEGGMATDQCEDGRQLSPSAESDQQPAAVTPTAQSTCQTQCWTRKWRRRTGRC